VRDGDVRRDVFYRSRSASNLRDDLGHSVGGLWHTRVTQEALEEVAVDAQRPAGGRPQQRSVLYVGAGCRSA